MQLASGASANVRSRIHLLEVNETIQNDQPPTVTKDLCNQQPPALARLQNYSYRMTGSIARW